MILRQRKALDGAQCVCAPFCQHPSCWKAATKDVNPLDKHRDSLSSEQLTETSLRPSSSIVSSPRGPSSKKFSPRSLSAHQNTEIGFADRSALPMLPSVTVSTLDFGFLEQIAKANELQNETSQRKVPYSNVIIEKLQQREQEKDSGASTMRTNLSSSSSNRMSIVGFQKVSNAEMNESAADSDIFGPRKSYVWVPGVGRRQRSLTDIKKESTSKSPAIRNLNDELNYKLPSPAIMAPENTSANVTENSSAIHSKFPSRMNGSMRRSQMTDNYSQSRLQAPIEFPEGKPLSMKEVYQMWDPANLENQVAHDPLYDGTATRVPVRSVMLEFEPDAPPNQASKAVTKQNSFHTLPLNQPGAIAGGLETLSSGDKSAMEKSLAVPPTSPIKLRASAMDDVINRGAIAAVLPAGPRRPLANDRPSPPRVRYVSLDLPGKASSFPIAMSANALVNLPRSAQRNVAFKPCHTPKRPMSVASSERMTDPDSASTLVTCDSPRSTLDMFWHEEEALERRRRQYFESRLMLTPISAAKMAQKNGEEQSQPVPPPTSPSPSPSFVASEKHEDETSEGEVNIFEDEALVRQMESGLVDQTFVTNWAASLLDRIAEEDPTRQSTLVRSPSNPQANAQ